jgi:hypothetical protein
MYQVRYFFPVRIRTARRAAKHPNGGLTGGLLPSEFTFKMTAFWPVLAISSQISLLSLTDIAFEYHIGYSTDWYPSHLNVSASAQAVKATGVDQLNHLTSRFNQTN